MRQAWPSSPVSKWPEDYEQEEGQRVQAAEQEELYDAVVHQHRSARNTCHLSDPAQACSDKNDQEAEQYCTKTRSVTGRTS